MRPEHLLAPDGETAGPATHTLVAAMERSGLTDIGGRKWTLPVLAAIDAGERRFAGVQALAPGVTARALTQALTQLEEAGLIGRVVSAERPPRSEYRLTPRGARLAPLIRRLAKALALQSEE